MYSELLVYQPDVLIRRAFIHTYIDGKRWRCYNGNVMGIECHPNRCTTIVDRNRELKRLERELHKLITSNPRKYV